MGGTAAAAARGRAAIEARLMRHRCTITPNVAPDGAGTPFTVRCLAMAFPQAGSGSGGFSGRHGGGGNQIARRFERSFALPVGTAVAIGDAIDWLDGGETIRVADVDEPGTDSLTLNVHGSRVSS